MGMINREKVIKGLEICKEINYCCSECPYYDRDAEMGCHCNELMADALEQLKEQDNWLGIHQTAAGITYISSGTAKQGEKRGIILGKALIYERLEKELLYRNLLTDDIRSAFEKVWGELE